MFVLENVNMDIIQNVSRNGYQNVITVHYVKQYGNLLNYNTPQSSIIILLLGSSLILFNLFNSSNLSNPSIIFPNATCLLSKLGIFEM